MSRFDKMKWNKKVEINKQNEKKEKRKNGVTIIGQPENGRV